MSKKSSRSKRKKPAPPRESAAPQAPESTPTPEPAADKPASSESASPLLALVAILAGALLNPWALGVLLVRHPGWIGMVAFWLGSLLGFLLLLGGLGALVFRRPLPAVLRVPAWVGLLGILLLSLYPNAAWLGLLGETVEDVNIAVERMLDSEQLLLDQNRQLRRLSRAAMNLELPDATSRALFGNEFQLRDMSGPASEAYEEEIGGLGIRSRHWPVSSEFGRFDATTGRFWRPLLDQVDYFEHAKFYFYDGAFVDEERTRWGGDVRFEGLARTADGSYWAVKAKQNMVWERVDLALEVTDSDAWRIVSWDLVDVATAEAKALAFTDVLDAALPVQDDRARARTSHPRVHHRALPARHGQARPRSARSHFPHRYYRPPAQGPPPGGLDRRHRWRRPMTTSTSWAGGAGTCSSSTGKTARSSTSPTGTGLPSRTTRPRPSSPTSTTTATTICFSVARSSAASTSSTRGGRFVDRGQSVDVPLPYLVSSISSVDFDNDGLLDVYFSTYASDAMRTDLMEIRGMSMTEMLADRRTDSQVISQGPLADFLDPRDTEALLEYRTAEAHGYHGYRNAFGPPNILLKNMGDGRFAEVKDAEALRTFRHTYQATWSDYDGDGGCRRLPGQ